MTKQKITDGCPAIEQALKEWHERGEEGDVSLVIDAIVEGLKDEIEVLTAVDFVGEGTEIDFNQEYSEDAVETEVEITFKTIFKDDEESWMVAFTNSEELEKGDETSMLPIPLESLLRITLDDENCDGLVINPWGFGINIAKDGIKNILDSIAPPTQDELDLNEGSEAYQRGDFEKAIMLYERAAEAGNVTALSNLGYCYYYGRSIPVDKVKARECWEKAAMLGDVCALYKMGDMYRNGDLPEDLEFSRQAYMRAFYLSLDDLNIYAYPDAFIRVIKHCSDMFELELLKQISKDCVIGLEKRIAEGDNFSGKLLEEARMFDAVFNADDSDDDSKKS